MDKNVTRYISHKYSVKAYYSCSRSWMSKNMNKKKFIIDEKKENFAVEEQ